MDYESRFALLEAVGNCTAAKLDQEVAQLEVLMTSATPCTSGEIEESLDRISALNCRMYAVQFLTLEDDEDDPDPEEMPDDEGIYPLPFTVRVK